MPGRAVDNPYNVLKVVVKVENKCLTQRNKTSQKTPHSPQKLPEEFAQEDKIWVLDFELTKQYQSNIEDAATIKDFYTVKTLEKDEDDRVEQNFLGQIESLDTKQSTISSKHELSKPARVGHYLVNFTALMYVRTPVFRQIMLETHEHMAKKMTTEMLKDEATFNSIMKKVKNEVKPNSSLSYEKAVEVQNTLI